MQIWELARTARPTFDLLRINMKNSQNPQVQNSSPAAEWDQDIARRALDELFRLAGEYRTTKEYCDLLDFVGRFRFYSPLPKVKKHRAKKSTKCPCLRVGYAKTIQINRGVIEVAEPLASCAKIHDAIKDPDSLFLSVHCRVQPGRRKPPVRKTSLNA